MGNGIKRIFVEKKGDFAVESKKMLNDLKLSLNIDGIHNLRIINRYDIEGIDCKDFKAAKHIIFSEKTVDKIYEEKLPLDDNEIVFAVEYLPGQYDQRADSAEQCIEILTEGKKSLIKFAKVYVINGDLNKKEIDEIKKYSINTVDSREALLEKSNSLFEKQLEPNDIEILGGFIDFKENELKEFLNKNGLAMSFEDLKLCQNYFKNQEKRNPTITEIKVIDTYWSDHCRHTTFMTEITDVDIEKSKYSDVIKSAYDDYINLRKDIGRENKPVCLMDIATIAAKELRKKGLLDDLDVSKEINACSIVVNANIDGNTEKWLVMFKNETHNHPTEIEPFGGAATCLGGAIRDPLSGRVYVYQAMRVTGAKDPTHKIEDTIEGKLPQKKITTEAAHGYSSYGNQIGLATGQVSEVYDDDYVAKRMEIGAVIGAAPMENVVRKEPIPGDLIILLGGRTGRDGIGGATGSSKEHTETSIETCGSEVQKGNAPTERKIQRLFRNKKVSTMIKRCNDFGAGGVSVAIGELTDGLSIDLNKVPKKYEGLDGTELAISESQERMAVVVSKDLAKDFIAYAKKENLEATIVAEVTDNKRLKMKWKKSNIVDLSRAFLDTNGERQKNKVLIKSPTKANYFNKEISIDNLKESFIKTMKDLNVCSKRGLTEMFDSTIGAGTVLMPLGGKYQSSPQEGMVAKLPVLEGNTNTATAMTYGFNPKISKWSPFHGALYAVVESVAKEVSIGVDYKNIKLTMQEYFEKLGKDPEKWGKPMSALLGALRAQREFKIGAIGGKDSMSGTFKDIHVPPTLVSFAVGVIDTEDVVSSEFKKVESKIVYVKCLRDENDIPDFDKLRNNFEAVHSSIKSHKVLSSSTVKHGGIAEAVSKMCFGNKIGVNLNNIEDKEIFSPDYGSIILEVSKDFDFNILKNAQYKVIGETQEKYSINLNEKEISLEKCFEAFEEPLESVFKTKVYHEEKKSENINIPLYTSNNKKSSNINIAKPRVIIPVFPGTNCEYDSKKAFEKAGAKADIMVINNMSSNSIKESIDLLASKIKKSNIVMLPGGFSAGDEPEGSGKFIATIFRNPKIKEAVMELLNNKDGLMLGICNGFQALIKLGLVPFGEIRDIDENAPTLTYNNIGRHQSKIVKTKIVSKLSPWFNNVSLGDIHSIPISHGEGRFYAKDDVMKKLIKNGQIATQYVDENGNPTFDIDYNPNGSSYAVEGICSIDGRVLGKMAHSERIGEGTLKNIEGNMDQKIFESGVQYFK